MKNVTEHDITMRHSQ